VRAAIYARVSTTDRHNEIQISELTEYIARRGWDLAGVYQDTMSGAKVSRPGLDALMAEARARRIDTVVVLKLDRLGWSVLNCVAGTQELTALGVRLIDISKGLDTDTSNPTSRLLLHILAALAEFRENSFASG
jgi:putative DNA-invertase from lambdoid prophage Rac